MPDVLLAVGLFVLVATPIIALRAWPRGWSVGDATYPERARSVFVGAGMGLATACALLAAAAELASASRRGGAMARIGDALLHLSAIGLAFAALGAFAIATVGWWRGRAWFATPPLSSDRQPR